MSITAYTDIPDLRVFDSTQGMFDATSGGSALVDGSGELKRWECLANPNGGSPFAAADYTLTNTTGTLGLKSGILHAAYWDTPRSYTLNTSGSAFPWTNINTTIIYIRQAHTSNRDGRLHYSNGAAFDMEFRSGDSWVATTPSQRSVAVDATNTPITSQHLLAFRGKPSTNLKMYVNNLTFDFGGADSSFTGSGGELFGRTGVSDTLASYRYVMIAPRGLTDAEISDIVAFATAQGHINVTDGDRYIAIGDSITVGERSNFGHGYPLQMVAPTGVRKYVVALSGQSLGPVGTSGTMLEQYTARTKILFKANKNHAVTIFAGANDLGGSRTAAAIYADLKTLCTNIKSDIAGISGTVKIGVFLNYTTFAWDPTTLNGLINAGFLSTDLPCDAVFDSSATAKSPDDNIHPSNAGYDSIVALSQSSITSWLETAPATPTGFTGTLGPTGVDLGWTQSTDATSMLIYRNTVNTFGTATLIDTAMASSTEYVDEATTAGVHYYWFLVAQNAAGNSSPAAFDGVSNGPLGLGGGLRFGKTQIPQLSHIQHLQHVIG